MKKYLFLIIALCIFSGMAIYFGTTSSERPQKEREVERSAEPVTLVFVGDIMMDRGVRRSVEKNFDGEYTKLFREVSYLQNADIAFANLEGPVGVTGRNVGSKFSFRMDSKVVPALRAAGVDVVSLANNHMGDYTREAFDETMMHLRASGIGFTGAGEKKEAALTPTIITVRNIRVGFLAASDVGPVWMKATDVDSGIAIATDPDFLSAITRAKAQTDVLVVSYHFGEEYSLASDRQKQIAHDAIDAGADMIIGHHPHVMQEMEIYNGKPIFYSLGNYIFDQYFSPNTMRGMVVTASIDPLTKTITTEQFVSELSREFVPQALRAFSADDLITGPFTP